MAYLKMRKRKFGSKGLEMATTVESIKNKLYKNLVTEGFFAQNPQTVRTVWMVIAGLALFTGNFFLAVVAFIFGRVMPRKTLLELVKLM